MRIEDFRPSDTCQAVLSSSLLADLSKIVDVTLPGPCPSGDARQFAAFALRDSLWKKFLGPSGPSKGANDRALEKFLASNDRCSSWSLSPNTSVDELLIGEVRKCLYDFWYVDDVTPLVSNHDQVFQQGRVGPGASVGANGMDFYTKIFDSKLTATKDLHYTWSRLATQTILADGLSSSRYGRKARVVESSTLSFVPKTTDISRTICTEPTINMWFQLGFGSILEQRMRRFFGIDLATQPDINRAMARVGSLSGRFSTLDLESASDSIGVTMLQAILPKSFMDFLMAYRCDSTRLPSGSRVALSMISSMGNGFTFPLETIIFSAIVLASYRIAGVRKKNGHLLDLPNWAVFGDDIIVLAGLPTRLVNRGLELLGFRVNARKSFVEGPFRESCGADYYSGTNVRGVYCKRLNTLADFFVLFNNLTRWSAKTEIALYETLGLLHRLVPRPLRYYVPADENDDAGFHCLTEHIPSYAIRGKGSRWSGPVTYKLLSAKATALVVGSQRVTVPRGARFRYFNADGLIAAFVLGYIRGNSITLRQDVVQYTTKRRITPRWDYLSPRPHEDPLNHSGDARRRCFARAWPSTW